MVRVKALSAAVLVVSAGCHRVPEEPLRRATIDAVVTASNSPSASASSVEGSATHATTAASSSASPRDTSRCIDREVVSASSSPRPAATCPPAPTPPPRLPRVVVRWQETDLRVNAELVKGAEQTSRGLMWRTKMAEDEGMLFDLESRSIHSFWMRNTCLPLDMLFIDHDGLIVGIVENVPVLNDAQREVVCPSRYVLEVNAGFAKKRGVAPGQHLSWN